jgi:outer membrane protein assembly factor BamB
MDFMLQKRAVTCAALALFGSLAPAEDWPQFRGPGGAGTSAETVTWPANGTKRIWKVSTPGGFSSFAAAGGKVFTVVARNVQGAPVAMCVALDAATGQELWTAPTGVAIFQPGGDRGAPGNDGGDGPRSTPAVNGDRVYVYSQDMVLHCLDAASGKPIWKRDILKEFSGRNIGWKSAMSPAIDGALVYVAGGGAGQSMLAFDQATGAVVWKSEDETMTHATPVVANILGIPVPVPDCERVFASGGRRRGFLQCRL